MATRVVRAYRTVSHAAATVLAGWPPLELLASMYAEVYRCEREALGAIGGRLPPKAKKIIRIHARRSMLERWNTLLSDPRTAGQRTVGAVRPCLSEWIDRAQGEVTFRLTQVLTGHGCFGKYLRQINREPTTACHHCPILCNTAQHTLEHCEAWCEQRGALRVVAGEDLSLPVLVAKMVGSEEVWMARRLLRGGGAAKGDGGAYPPSGIGSAINIGGGAAAAGADSSDEGEGGSEGDEGVVRTPPLRSPPTPAVRRSQRLALRGAMSLPTQGR